jgi:hypothetical protein
LKNKVKCVECESPLDSRRSILGLKKCLKCSDVEKYSGHTVYPHKTGGYIQPVSQEQSDHLKKLDRRRVGGNKTAKGIFADNSWDRWLNSYYDNIYNKTKPKKPSKKFFKKFSHMKTKTLYQKTVKVFMEYGYHRAVDEVNELYSRDKISLPQKGKMVSNLTELQMMTSKEKKFFKKLNKDQL